MAWSIVFVFWGLLGAQADHDTQCKTTNNGLVIEDLKSQMASLQGAFQKMKEEQNKTAKPEFYINFCAPTNDVSMGFRILNAVGASTNDHFCQALSSKDADSGIYDISLSLYNDKGRSGNKNLGHPGIIFNAKDPLNYDFIYFRPHSTSGCFQTGYIVNGEPKFVKSTFCPDSVLAGRTWTKFKILVRTGWAYVLMKNKLVDIITTHYSPLGRGGAMAYNGYENVVFFKDYLISKPAVVLSPIMVQGCSAGTGWLDPSTLVLSAIGKSWEDGFCRVQHTVSLSVSRYQFTAELYNVRGNKGANYGHPGVMFNMQDMNNFDFVYFRPHWAGGCYQTGCVKNGVIRTVNTGPCTRGPPRPQLWITVNVKVHSNRNVQVFLDGHHVKTLVPHFGVTPKAGVIVANGYENTIQARSLKIQNI